ncbi:hypothetical protein [Pseudomonas sp. JR33AA]|nr:hypothetical protein [Pseudomonas sp. JR33AA]MCE5978914.1 hypothetical protein [Pseudomonas sp. JR33AA]
MGFRHDGTVWMTDAGYQGLPNTAIGCQSTANSAASFAGSCQQLAGFIGQ